MKNSRISRVAARVAMVWTVAGTLWISGNHVEGFSYFQYGGVNVTWIGAQSIRYLSPSTFPEGSEPDGNILEAMGLWNVVPACDFEYSYSRLDQDYPIDNFDGFNDTAAVPAELLDPGVLGVTYLVNDGPYWFDMDVLFSDLPSGVGYNFEYNPDCDTIVNPVPDNGFSFLLVAVHELGHALGLGHDPIGNETPGSPFIVQTMNPRYPSGGPIGQDNIIELHSEDRAGVRFLYPHSGPSDPPYIDLASPSYTWSSTQMGKAIPVFFTPASVEPSDELTVRSVIENLGTTNEFSVRQGFYLSPDPVITSDDMLVADVRWDLAFEDTIDFDAVIDMPADLPAGPYYVGTIFDDLNEVTEEWEDNNAASYCTPLTVKRLAPVINNLGQEIIPCGVPYTGPTPTVTHPLNMAPMTWSIDNPQPGMTIDPDTGALSWPSPVRSEFAYTIFIRATNSRGSSTQILFLGVTESAPAIVEIAPQTAACGVPYTGPAPQITAPSCMNPIINWSLDSGPPGMSIDFNTGRVFWPNPIRDGSPYQVTIRATNGSGNGTRTFALDVIGTSDRDGDGDVDLGDYEAVGACHVGPGVDAGGACDCADIDGDGDVDLADLAIFMQEFTGPITGACCFANGSCADQGRTECQSAGGTYQGDFTTCATTTCLGACCFPNGFCIDLSPTNCQGAGGEFQGAGTACATTECITGACCHPDESCTEGPEDECLMAGGTYQGDDTLCAGSDCTLPPVGACCQPDESCVLETEGDCITGGGVYFGDETDCSTVNCSAAVGACCNPLTWSCSDGSEASCLAEGGTFEGDGTTCASTACPEYLNVIDPVTTWYAPGANFELADDITLSGSARRLVYYDLAVYGGGGGVFDVTAGLYTGCPGEGGTLIAGTDATWEDIPDDGGVYTLSADLSDAPVTLPSTVWMVTTFSTNDAGWILAEAAEVGFTADRFGENDPPWGCDFGFDGTPAPHAGFWASLQCISGPPGQGACCHPDESCTEGTSADCLSAGGTYKGDGTGCATVSCAASNEGACCLHSGWTCTTGTAANCTAAGGSYEGNGTTCGAITCPEYRNDINPASSVYAPGENGVLADRMELTGAERDLVYYQIAVADGSGSGSGTFDLGVELWDDSPCNGGATIAGTGAIVTGIPANGQLYLIGLTLQAPVTLPDTVYMVAQFSTGGSGWVLAEQAEVGFTDDAFSVYLGSSWDCAQNFGGAPANPYAGFWGVLQCVDAGGGRSVTADLQPVVTIMPLDADGVPVHAGDGGATGTRTSISRAADGARPESIGIARRR